MAMGTKICKVCGKEYEACHTLRPNLNNEFRWQDVACCEAHGREYLACVLASRGQRVQEEQNAPAGRAEKKRMQRKARRTDDTAEVVETVSD